MSVDLLIKRFADDAVREIARLFSVLQERLKVSFQVVVVVHSKLVKQIKDSLLHDLLRSHF